MGAQDSKFAHTPIMTVDLEFSWPQFLWIAFIFVGVPTTIGASIIWTIWRSERTGVEHSTTALDAGRTGSGPLGLWRTGLLAFALGFLSCVGWLSWSADYKGGFRGPGLPAPTQFPPWQVFACGLTVILACFVSAHRSQWMKAGGLTAAAGTAAGFTTAFSIDASTDATGQAGVGVALSTIGWGLTLTALMLLRGKWSRRE
ncbi:hypothetical protein ACKAMS_29045 [Rhodococcus sp. 5A-K4]|uniref:hypothetical protein n=1 Tax=Rhodococcus TaxID=1827 RepID=UPI0009BA09F1|nr:hypothetical protein [Rhodococcus erythropolis]